MRSETFPYIPTHERIMTQPSPTPQDVEPISPQEARAILDAAIAARLGDNWDDEQEGWTLVSGHDYMARLARGRRSVDFYVDLLGNVIIQENDDNPVQGGGRLLALALLGGSALLALVLARIAGYL